MMICGVLSLSFGDLLIILGILTAAGECRSPVVSSSEILFIEDEPIVNGTEEKHPFMFLKIRKGRQDDDGDGNSGESNVVPLTAGATSAYVGQILAGVFSGNISSIFSGSAGFIGERDIRQNVGMILLNVGNPLTYALQTVLERTGYYLGFTTAKPKLQNRVKSSTTVAPADYENVEGTTVSAGNITAKGKETDSSTTEKAKEKEVTTVKVLSSSSPPPEKKNMEAMTITLTPPPAEMTTPRNTEKTEITTEAVEDQDQDDSFEDSKRKFKLL